MPRLQKQKNKNNKKLKLLITAVAVVVLAGGAVLALKLTHNGPFAEKTKNTSAINYDPPTEEEKQETEDHKEDLGDGKDGSGDDGTSTPTDSSGLRSVTPFITIAQQFTDQPAGNRVEVRAYVSGIVESGGTCEAVLSKGGKQVKKSSSAQPDATTTTCDTVSIARGDIPESGTWSATVTYTSSAAKGTSEAVQVEVQ